MRVRLSFADGTVKTLQLGRTLEGKRASIVEVPPGKALTQLAVTTARHTRGTYSVHGSTEGRAIATR